MTQCLYNHSSVVLVLFSIVATRNINTKLTLVSAEKVRHSGPYIIIYICLSEIETLIFFLISMRWRTWHGECSAKHCGHDGISDSFETYLKIWPQCLCTSLTCLISLWCFQISHDDVIKWNDFPIYWPFVRGIHRSPHKGQWRGALMFSLICAWINGYTE